MSSYLDSCGIRHSDSFAHAHAQNWTAERKHRHIVETGLSFLSHASLPLSYWSYAFETASFLINRPPTSILQNLSPLECMFHLKPAYKFFWKLLDVLVIHA